MEAMKSTYKLTLFSDTESAHEGSSNAIIYSPDPATNELLIDMGRGLYKLLFQLLLLIESDHKISISVIHNLRQNEKMDDLSGAYMNVRGALLRCIDDADMDSLDTSTSTEGEHPTPTPSPGPQPTALEFENILIEMIDAQKWSLAVAHVRQYRKYASNWSIDDISIILNVYAQRLVKDRTGT